MPFTGQKWKEKEHFQKNKERKKERKKRKKRRGNHFMEKERASARAKVLLLKPNWKKALCA